MHIDVTVESIRFVASILIVRSVFGKTDKCYTLSIRTDFAPVKLRNFNQVKMEVPHHPDRKLVSRRKRVDLNQCNA
jgi:hypothetical protein